MKARINHIILIVSLILLSVTGYSQPEPPGSPHGSNSNANGGNAPLGEGLGTLLLMASVYAIKSYKSRDEKK